MYKVIVCGHKKTNKFFIEIDQINLLYISIELKRLQKRVYIGKLDEYIR